MSVHNLGLNGLMTQGLLKILRFNRSLRQLVSQAALITITIGSNDLLHLMRNSSPSIITSQLPLILSNMGKTLDQVGNVVRQLNPTAIVKVATLYNPLLAGPYSQYYVHGQRIIDSANAIIVTWARRYGFVLVDLDREIRGKERSLIGPDYGHPSVAGYQAIAKAFAR